MNIRNSAKAILIRGDKILLTKNKDNEGDFYLFPGGGQEHGETINNTLIRECIEETGHEIKVGNLLHIREYIGKNHEHSSFDFNVHQVEYYFGCTIVGDISNNQKPTNPDTDQVGIEWITIRDIMKYRIYPKKLRQYIIKYFNGDKAPVYLGDIN
ncbi:NUDIX domain-containing protein [Pullulanibacillus sp. KACC 23026]|uniref:NUDIX domain-containing protein n=1 Tax=Pullulanibacillus sp. KACC 23026 TaxID=3028315 RepID=UPI0023AFD0C9|nr:NUDIX domain-containing protein [Pullulanibacillus sp. KACC 23026]WEG14494.1 NUDIX domain-containing protein [Pullulanibacillus sp. KACC 23026]